jgi:hypothetical protein
MADIAVELTGISKFFADVAAVDRIDLTVAATIGVLQMVEIDRVYLMPVNVPGRQPCHRPGA